jgi:hypothetical protein
MKLTLIAIAAVVSLAGTIAIIQLSTFLDVFANLIESLVLLGVGYFYGIKSTK